ncbi:MAG: retroviral-like aspartic protease family protein [Muribaculaceae bacterium]|nr:retroviral-like aspartic protease family protein [Muribaculaceae bacterium]
MLRKILLYVFVGFLSLSGYSQSIDEKIGNAMNRSDWFALDSIYNSVPKDSIHPFLEVYSRCLLGNRLNRPDVSVPAFQELFNTQSEYLDLGNMISATFMFGMDLSRIGQNEAAASMTNSILDATRQYLDSVTVSNLTSQAHRYSALAAYNPYQIEFNGNSSAKVPFAIVPVGPTEKGSVLMRLKESTINGIPADITFDTGAGTNLISPEMAEKYNLIPLEGTRITVGGVAQKDGYMAIANELQLGNITVKDVPFSVVSISADNSEADQYTDAFSIILGSDLMLQLKEVNINFFTNTITVPSKAPFIPVKTDAKPNLCFSSSMNLLCKGTIHNEPMLMCIDSGDASYGSIGNAFFERNRQYVLDNGIKDTVRMAGIGGVNYFDCYKLSNMKLSLGNHRLEIPEIVVTTEQEAGLGGQYECIIGLRTLMLYTFVRFNLVDFVLTTGISRNARIR